MNIRKECYNILKLANDEETYVGEVLGNALRRMQFENKRDRAFLTKLTEGVVERRISLDYLIDKFSKKSPDADTRIILRMGIYQIKYMESVPDRAAISESVELCKAVGLEGRSGYVNALLRKVATLKEEKKLDSLLVSKMEVRYSTPKWICDMLVANYGKDNAKLILEDQFKDHDTVIRVNSLRVNIDKTQNESGIQKSESDSEVLKCESESEIQKSEFDSEVLKSEFDSGIQKSESEVLKSEFDSGILKSESESEILKSEFDFKIQKSEIKKKFEKAGVTVRDGLLSDRTLRISNYDSVTRLPGFRDGLFIVQDETSVYAIEHAGIKPGDRVLDMCASPGGKSLLAYEIAASNGTEAFVTSCDISDMKLEKIRENAERLGIPCGEGDIPAGIRILRRDALSEPAENEKESYDVVIADVPCSGLGVMGRKNDIKYNVTAESAKSLAEQGLKILKNASRYVNQSGRIIFSTCTINPQENERVVEAFLEGKDRVDKESPTENNSFKLLESRTFLQGIDGSDGFFYAVMERI